MEGLGSGSRCGILSTAECNNRRLVYSSQYNDQKVRHVVYSACAFEEEIGKVLIATKALLLYRSRGACGLLESIFQPIVQE